MIRKLILKDRLNNVFRTGDLCQETDRNGRKLRKYPRIMDIRIKEDKTVFVFRLPPGLNPADLKKKEYIFFNYFGENLEIKSNEGIYSLTVYKKELDKTFTFDYEELRAKMNNHRLPILTGKDRHGHIHTFDMVRNPHVLIAGETGSGKSVTLRSIITSLIMHKRKGLEFYLADLKRSEFHVFRNVDTVKAVMTKKEQVTKCLAYLKKEMSERGDLLDFHEVEHIDEYNKLEVEKKPYIILCIDEYAQLKKDTDITEVVDEIGRIGRALGVFLILSMQRPDSKVLEGGLKANLTVQFAFRARNRLNSTIILGNVNEDCSKIKESEPGKFYFSNGDITLMQAPLLELDECKALLEPFKETRRETIENVEYREEGSEDFAPLMMLEEGEDERKRQTDS